MAFMTQLQFWLTNRHKITRIYLWRACLNWTADVWVRLGDHTYPVVLQEDELGKKYGKCILASLENSVASAFWLARERNLCENRFYSRMRISYSFYVYFKMFSLLYSPSSAISDKRKYWRSNRGKTTCLPLCDDVYPVYK